MYVYLPSCNFTRTCPEASAKIKAFMARKSDVRVAGCCRPEQKKLTAEDTVLAICQSCEAITREVSPQAKVLSLWEYAIKDADFPWPDFHGEEMTLQDCWRARNNPALLDAVRTCMERMNLRTVEMAENREHTTFDGVWLHQPVRPGNLAIAPNYFGEIREKYAQPLPEEEQQARMREWAQQYTTERVAAYCNACLRGIRMGGARGVHLMELMTENM